MTRFRVARKDVARIEVIEADYYTFEQGFARFWVSGKAGTVEVEVEGGKTMNRRGSPWHCLKSINAAIIDSIEPEEAQENE